MAGMKRQALRNAMVRYNSEGLDGLHDPPRLGAKPRLNDKQREQLRQISSAGQFRRSAALPPVWHYFFGNVINVGSAASRMRSASSARSWSIGIRRMLTLWVWFTSMV